MVALGLDGFVATLQPDAHFGRILAAYGGVFVAGSLAWGMVVDKFPPRPVGCHRRRSLPARRRGDHVRASGGVVTFSGANVERHKVAVRRLVKEVVNRGQLDVISDDLHPAAAEAARRWIEPFLNSFGDVDDADR